MGIRVIAATAPRVDEFPVRNIYRIYGQSIIRSREHLLVSALQGMEAPRLQETHAINGPSSQKSEAACQQAASVGAAAAIVAGPKVPRKISF